MREGDAVSTSTGYVQRFDSDSAISNLDARVKLVLILCVLVLVFSWRHPIYLGGLVLGVVVLSLLGGIPFGYIGRLMLVTLPFAIILVLIHGFFNKWFGVTPLLGPVPESVPVLGGRLALYKEGTLFGLGMAGRTYALMLVMPMVISTTDMNQLVLALIRFRVPYKITFVFTTAMRFAPLLLQQTQAIQDAQALRGLDISEMGILRRLKVRAAMAVPLILGTMAKSTNLEIALQARAFSGSGDRTYLHKIEMGPLDWLVTGVAVGGTIFAVVARILWGAGAFEFVSVYA
jgi:energy-coupling factor transport system permease protein